MCHSAKNFPPITSSKLKAQANQPYKYIEVDTRTPKIKRVIDAQVALLTQYRPQI